jgi:hypothetical protein
MIGTDAACGRKQLARGADVDVALIVEGKVGAREGAVHTGTLVPVCRPIMATSAAESPSQTESLFAENNEPFFNTIGHKQTKHFAPKSTDDRYSPKADIRRCIAPTPRRLLRYVQAQEPEEY